MGGILRVWPERIALGRLLVEMIDEFTSPEISPPVDIYEDGEGVTVEVEIPGVLREAIQVSINASQVIVEGTKIRVLEEEGVSYSLVEQAFGRFRRVIELPRLVNTAKAEARLENGVLTIRLPKVEERRCDRRSIPIE